MFPYNLEALTGGRRKIRKNKKPCARSGKKITETVFSRRVDFSMQLSRKADYALRAVAYVSQLKKNELASIGRIAKARNIPREFLAKILKELTRAGILVSFQGVTGGYRLARPAREVSFLDVIEAMEGPVAVNLCVDGSHTGCTRDKGCEIRPFFVKQQDLIIKAFKRQTFGGISSE
jgi:Rrf2 family protein